MLTSTHEISVRFSEIDSLGILWHGHYIQYFEDGRESFGKKYNLSYLAVFNEGYTIPLVNVECNFKRPIRYNDEVMVETTFIDSPAAKIIFEYKLFNKETKETYATGKSVQVFLDNNNELFLTSPTFFVEWKKRWAISNTSK